MEYQHRRDLTISLSAYLISLKIQDFDVKKEIKQVYKLFSSNVIQ